nr:MAG TPA: hypothetical protein [Bacteriophage sp.]
MTALPGLSFLCLPALHHVYAFMLGIPVCNRLVYHLATQRRIEKRREEKKKEYTRKNLAVLFFRGRSSSCLPFLCLSSYDILLSRL